MARSKVKLNGRGVEAVLKSKGVNDFLLDRMNRVAEAARREAPVSTGEYRDSIEALIESHPTRTVGHVIARAPHSLKIEAEQGVLGRALDAAGD